MAGIERDGILPKFVGILSHDHEAKFYNYGTSHSTCGDHLCRTLKGLLDLEKIQWAGLMRNHMMKMDKHKKEDLKKGITSCKPNLLEYFEKEYDDLIERGRVELGQMQENELGYNEFDNMLDRLTDYKDCYLLFIRDYKAPFSNNLAERDLRMLKTKQKVSGLFRSWDGINNYLSIRSFISTIKKRKMNLFSAIAKVISGVSVLSYRAAHAKKKSSAA
jgi:transposase